MTVYIKPVTKNLRHGEASQISVFLAQAVDHFHVAKLVYICVNHFIAPVAAEDALLVTFSP